MALHRNPSTHDHSPHVREDDSKATELLKPMANAKYVWGSEDPFPLYLNFVLMSLGSTMVSAVILSRPEREPAINHGCGIKSVKMTILATIIYFFVFYQLLGEQTALKVILKSTNEAAHQTADRIVFNTLEQMGPYLVLNWLFTIYVDADLGGRFGILYAILVVFYAVGYTWYGHFTVCVEISTQPRYIMIMYMASALVRAAFLPDKPTLKAVLPSSWASLSVLLFIAEFLFTIPGWMVLGLPLAKLNASNNPSKKRD